MILSKLGPPTTITFSAIIQNIKELDLEILAQTIKAAWPIPIKTQIVAINSNFCNVCMPGFEKFIKRTKTATGKTTQGNNSCFSSCVEFMIQHEGKYYKPKLFPRTGQVQLAGGTREDLTDCRACIEKIITFLTYLLKPDASVPFTVSDESISLMNYKFHVNVGEGVLDLLHIHALLAAASNGADFANDDGFTAGTVPVINISSIKETNQLTATYNGMKIVIQFRGKINISVSKSRDNAVAIYNFLDRLLTENNCIVHVPLTDYEYFRPEMVYSRCMKLLDIARAGLKKFDEIIA